MEDEERKTYQIFMDKYPATAYCVDIDTVERANYFYRGLWSYFGIHVIMTLWPDCDHVIGKWNECNYNGNVDVQRFYNSLDSGNKRLVITWYNNRMKSLK